MPIPALAAFAVLNGSSKVLSIASIVLGALTLSAAKLKQSARRDANAQKAKECFKAGKRYYFKSHKSPQDQLNAQKYFEEALNYQATDPKLFYLLATIYQEKSSAKQQSLAQSYYEKAALSGHEGAKKALFYLKFRHFTTAKQWVALGKNLSLEENDEIKDEKAPALCFEKALSLDAFDAEANFLWAEHYRKTKDLKIRRKVEAHYQKAASSGHLLAQIILRLWEQGKDLNWKELGELYFFGEEDFSKDYFRAHLCNLEALKSAQHEERDLLLKRQEEIALALDAENQQTQPSAFITLDDKGEYFFSAQVFHFPKKKEKALSMSFYDGKSKVLSYQHDAEGHLSLQCYTPKKVRIAARLEAVQGEIKAQGPLALEGEIRFKQALSIVADALLLQEALDAGESLRLMVETTLELHGAVYAAYVDIKAKRMYAQQIDVQLLSYWNLVLEESPKRIEPKMQSASPSDLKNKKSISLETVPELKPAFEGPGQCLIESLSIAKNAAFFCANGAFVVNTLRLEGNLHLERSYFKTQTKLDNLQGSQLFLANHAVLETQALDLNGELEAHNSKMLIARFSSKENSKIILEGAAGLSVEKADLKGPLETVLELKAGVSGPSPMPCFSGQKVTIHKNAKCYGKSLMIEVERLNQAGELDFAERILARGTHFKNKGSIKADFFSLGMDGLTLNQGRISSKNFILHGNLLNILGRIYAEQQLLSSGFFNLNLGLIIANNYNNNSLASINAGIVLPYLSANPAYFFSPANLITAIKTLALAAVPAYSNSVQLLFMIPGLMSTLKSVYENITHFDKNKMKSLRLHELMPLIGQLKNLGLFGLGAVRTTGASCSEFQSLSSDLPSLLKGLNSLDKLNFACLQSLGQKIEWKALGTKAASIFMGTHADSSLVHVNVGASAAINTIDSSFLHVNTGLEGSLNQHHVDTSVLENKGLSVGAEATYLANKINNSGVQAGINGFTLRAKKVHNKKYMGGDKAQVQIERLEQDGDLKLKNGQANINIYRTGETGNNGISNMQIKGKEYENNGSMQGKDTLFQYDESFETKEKGKNAADNMKVITKKYANKGAGTFEHIFEIEAKNYEGAKGASLIGAKTAEEELFVINEGSAGTAEAQKAQPTELVQNEASQASPEQASIASEQGSEKIQSQDASQGEGSSAMPANGAEKTEPEKEFKPQHILKISAETVEMNEEFKGGDYSLIQGLANPEVEKSTENPSELTRCKKIYIGPDSKIDKKYGDILTEELGIDGNPIFENYNINMKETHISKGAAPRLKSSQISGDHLVSDGSLGLDHSRMGVKKIELTENADDNFKDSVVESEALKDSSHLTYEGQVSVLTKKYDHDGKILHHEAADQSKDDDLFYLKTQTAELKGSGDIKQAYYEIEHFADSEAFLAGIGDYGRYHFSDHLSYATADQFCSNITLNRDCDLNIKAAKIVFSGLFNSAHNLAFISTLDDVLLLSDLQAKNLYVNSAANIYLNHKLNSDEQVYLEAKDNIFNLGGKVTGNTVAAKAGGSIKNISAGSALAQPSQNWGIEVGGDGVMKGRQKLFMEAESGDIENWGGFIGADEYAQLKAKGNVTNLCNTRRWQGAYDSAEIYDAALIAGGTGNEETGGLGLYIQADGKVISEASDFKSIGSNYISGKQGVELNERYNSYISLNRKIDHTFETKYIFETSTVLRGSSVQSLGGRNIIHSEEGGVKTTAAQFISPGGTDIFAKKEILLYSLKLNNQHKEITEILGGIFGSRANRIREESTPTLFLDNGCTRLHSETEGVDARGAYFIGKGDLEIEAKGRIQLGTDILDYSSKEKRLSPGLSTFGVNAANVFHQGGNTWDAVCAEDSTAGKASQLIKSNNALEATVNSSNLAINLYNRFSSLMGAYGNDQFLNTLFGQYGLSDGNMCPIINASLTRSKTEAHTQMQAQGGINRGGNVKLKSGKGIDIENGAPVLAGGNIEIDAPELIAKGVGLETSTKQEQNSISLGLSSSGVQSVGISHSETKTKSTHYVNSLISAGGNIKMHHDGKAMDKVVLDAANIQATTMDAEIEHLEIYDRQDKSSSKSSSFGICSSGQVSFYKGQGTEQRVAQKSGIYVKEGLNSQGHTVNVKDAKMVGGQIITDGENNFQPEHLKATEVVDSGHYRGSGVSFNTYDCNRLFDGGSNPAPCGPVIATAAMTVDYSEYQAINTPVINGAQATNIKVGELEGNIHTENAQGQQVIKDKQIHINVDIPITDQAHIKQSVKDIKSGLQRLAPRFFKPAEEQTIYVTQEEAEKIEECLKALKKQQEAEKRVSEEKKSKENASNKVEQKEEHASSQDKEGTEISPVPMEEPQEQVGAMDYVKNKENSDKDESKNKKAIDKKKPKKNSEEVSNDSDVNKNKIALTQLFKAYGEVLIEEFLRYLHEGKPMKPGMKIYHLGKGSFFVTLIPNLFMASLQGNKEVIKSSLKETAAELTLGTIIKTTMGAAALGFTITSAVFGVVDTLFYNEKVLENMLQNSKEDFVTAQSFWRQGEYFKCSDKLLDSFNNFYSVCIMKVMHNIANLSDYVKNGFYFMKEMAIKSVGPSHIKGLPGYNESCRF